MAYFSTDSAKREIVRKYFSVGWLRGWDKTQVITVNIANDYEDFRQLEVDNFIIQTITASIAAAGEAIYDNVGGAWFSTSLNVQSYNPITGDVTIVYKQTPGGSVHRSVRIATEECSSYSDAYLCIIP